ncbi:MAG: zinc metallopeptidase [Synergistetes bacterium]|nr:zinc metallopeptidase [Synergistota bacterium]
MLFFWDKTILLLIPALILSIYAQYKVNSEYRRYSEVPSSLGKPGWKVAEEILSAVGLHDVRIERISGELTDHYDPRDKVLRLSDRIYNSRSIAALGILAHEIGHALQDKEDYVPLKLRGIIVPVANIGSNLAIPFFFLGFIFYIPTLMDIGILAFSLAVLFQLITLPVEFDASRRAIKLLTNLGLVSNFEIKGVKAVLWAAAMTYVAATAMAALQLLRLIILRGERE